MSKPRIDTHFHVFQAGAATAARVRYRPSYDATLAQWESFALPAGVARGLLVQPSFLGTDNSQLLAALAARPASLRAVAVLDPVDAAARIPVLHGAGVRGLRWNLAGLASFDGCGAPEWDDALRVAHGLGWHLEIHTDTGRLSQALARLPATPIPVVLDHLGRLAPSGESRARDLDAARREAARRELWVKLSGPYRNPGLDLRAVARAWLALVGPDHLLWGSDWPWTNHEAGQHYDRLQALAHDWVGDLAPADRLDANALRLLRWD